MRSHDQALSFLSLDYRSSRVDTNMLGQAGPADYVMNKGVQSDEENVFEMMSLQIKISHTSVSHTDNQPKCSSKAVLSMIGFESI